MKPDLDEFKKLFLKWAEYFDLSDWKFYFEQKRLTGNFATVRYNVHGCICVVVLTNRIAQKDRSSLDQIAFHEAMEVFLGRLVFLAEARYLDESEITTETHRIIRFFENKTFGYDRSCRKENDNGHSIS